MLQQAEVAAIPQYGDEAIDFSVFTAYPIPLMTRIDTVEPSTIPGASFSVDELSELLGVRQERVISTLKVVGATAEGGFDFNGSLPGYIVPVLQTELKWQDTYNELPAYISTSTAAELMGRARITVKRFATEHDYISEREDLNQAVYLHLYPKSMLLEMRAELMDVAAPVGSVTIEHLMQVTGMGRTWIVNHLRDAGYDYEERWDEVAKRQCRHYPDEAEDYLLELKMSLPNKAPEGWVTARQLRGRLMRGEDWVSARLKKYEVFALELLDSRNIPFTYYPPHVFEELSRLSAEERELVPIGENLTIPEAMKATGYTRAALRNILEILQITPERRTNSDGRIFGTLNTEMIQAINDFDMQRYLRDSLKQAIKSYGEGHVEASIQIDQLRAELRELEHTQELERRAQIQSDIAASKALARSFARRRLDALRKLEQLEKAS
jgi:DNA-binding transcriptional MerR regulator